MGQVIEVPGQGPVEFPDGMTDDQIVAAIKKNSMAPKPATQAEIYQDTVKNRGWGSGAPEFIHELGGKVTDLTGSPVAGGVTNFLLNAIPAFLTAGKVQGAPTSLAEGPASWLMQKAVKPNKAARLSGDADDAIKTMLDEVIYPTVSGMDKAGNIAGKMESLIDDPLSKSTGMVKVRDIHEAINDVYTKLRKQMAPQGDLDAIRKVSDDFFSSPNIAGKDEIPVQLAHELKKGTYSALGGKAYGEVGAASIEAQKALARGARKEVGNVVPEVRRPLERQASMMNVMDVAADRALLEGNKNLLSLAPIASHPVAAISFLADRWAALKAFAALQTYHGAKPQVLAPLGIAAGQANQSDPALLKNQAGALYQYLRGTVPPRQ